MSDKVTVQTIDSLQNQTSAIQKLNSNFSVLAEKIDTLLSRDGDTPNQMESSLDMNSNRILNLPEPVNNTEPVRKVDLNEVVLGGVPNLSIDDSKIANLSASKLIGTVSNNQLANMPQATVKGRATGAGTGEPANLTATELRNIVGTFSNTTNGLAPSSGGGTTNFLRADGTWAAPPASGSPPASSVTFTPSGNIASNNVQSAIQELDSEKAGTASFSSSTPGLAPASGGGTTNFLRADGTWTTPSSSGITLGTQQATTSGTQFDFTGLPAGLNEIVVSFDGVSLSGTDHLLVQLGTSGGVETTGYVSTSTLAFAGSTAQSANSTTGFIVFVGNATFNLSGQMIIRRMSGNKWTKNHAGLLSTASTASGGGVKTLSGQIDRVRILASGSNTFDAGFVNISFR